MKEQGERAMEVKVMNRLGKDNITLREDYCLRE